MSFYKVALCFAAVFLLTIIAIACTFFYEFLQAYKTELNRALFYALLCFGGLILLAFASATVYAVALLALHYQSKRLYNLERQQTLQAVCNNNRLFEVTANQIAAGQIYLTEQRTEQGTVRFKSLPRPTKFPLESALALPEPEPQELKTTLLNDISDCQRLLIVGASGTGKTSLLLHIAQHRQQHGDLIILDSNGKKGKWGLYPVIGLGYNHQAIKDELLRLNEVLKSRFDEYAFRVIEWHIISLLRGLNEGKPAIFPHLCCVLFHSVATTKKRQRHNQKRFFLLLVHLTQSGILSFNKAATDA